MGSGRGADLRRRGEALSADMLRVVDTMDNTDPIDAITTAAAILAEYPSLALITEHLLGYPAELIVSMTGEENASGRSVRDKAILARRNALLRQLGEGVSTADLSKELNTYFTDAWPRDR